MYSKLYRKRIMLFMKLSRAVMLERSDELYEKMLMMIIYLLL